MWIVTPSHYLYLLRLSATRCIQICANTFATRGIMFIVLLNNSFSFLHKFVLATSIFLKRSQEYSFAPIFVLLYWCILLHSTCNPVEQLHYKQNHLYITYIFARRNVCSLRMRKSFWFCAHRVFSDGNTWHFVASLVYNWWLAVLWANVLKSFENVFFCVCTTRGFTHMSLTVFAAAVCRCYCHGCTFRESEWMAIFNLLFVIHLAPFLHNVYWMFVHSHVLWSHCHLSTATISHFQSTICWLMYNAKHYMISGVLKSLLNLSCENPECICHKYNYFFLCMFS